MYCVNCGVKLADSEQVCPLCATAVFHPDIRRREGEPLYPRDRNPGPQVSSRGAQIIATALFLLPLLVCLLCDLQLSGRVSWSGYVAGGLITGYVIFVLLCYLAWKTSQAVLIKRVMSFGIDKVSAADYLDGLCFARIVLIPTFIVLMPIVMAALGGDCIAGEMQDGSLKLYMARPRSRGMTILIKFLAVYIAGFAYSAFFSIAGLITGVLLFGVAPAQVVMLSGHFFGSQVTVMTNSEALSLYGLTALYFSFSLMTLGSMALFFSTVFNRMSSAAITVVTLYFVSFVTSSLPFAAALRPWLISEIMNNAFLIYISPVPWGKLTVNLALLAIYICSFLLLSLLTFNYKDIK
jgi:ABC-type transport system involved in multi-copper enzyme maturation permease subunit